MRGFGLYAALPERFGPGTKVPRQTYMTNEIRDAGFLIIGDCTHTNTSSDGWRKIELHRGGVKGGSRILLGARAASDGMTEVQMLKQYWTGMPFSLSWISFIRMNRGNAFVQNECVFEITSFISHCHRFVTTQDSSAT